MTHSPDVDGAAPDTDLAYDLAHEGADAGRPVASAAPPVARMVIATADYDGGDYSYDLAHDVPRA